jgi:hypothetical protein
MSFFIISCNNKDDKGKDAKISSRIIKFSTLGTNFTKELNEKLFKAVMEGKIKAYRYDSLTPGCMFQKDEIAKISTIEESVQYAPDSTHPDFLVDTVIKQVFDPSGITGYSVAEKWSLETEENSMEADIFAFALNWQPTIAGIALRESPLFWVDYKEVQKLLSKGQVEELNKTIYNSLIEKLSE